jgi:pyrroline-5-carboxylate reductase
MAHGTPILLVGCGKMGGAMLAGWRDRGIAPDQVVAVEPSGELARSVAQQHGITVVAKADDLPAELRPATLVMAVKPQMMDEAIGAYVRHAAGGALVLSIAAGKTIAYFERHLGQGVAVVRSMPNTPAAVGRGITAMAANPHVTPAQRGAAEDLLAAVGETVWLDDEGLLDAVTAVSGGGPAYVFLLIETLAKAGIAAGLPEDVAMRLARATVTGSGELAHRSDEGADQLRKNVTSPGGTTLEALKVLMADGGIQPLFDRAIAAATARSRELAG